MCLEWAELKDGRRELTFLRPSEKTVMDFGTFAYFGARVLRPSVNMCISFQFDGTCISLLVYP